MHTRSSDAVLTLADLAFISGFISFVKYFKLFICIRTFWNKVYISMFKGFISQRIWGVFI